MPVARIARICGFKDSEEAERYLRDEELREEREAHWKTNPEASRYWAPHQQPPHEHVFSALNGECLWRTCEAKRG